MAVQLISQAVGAVITDALSTWQTPANAFDGTTVQTVANSAAANGNGAAPAGANYIGKDWAGVNNGLKTVLQVRLYGPSNNSLMYGGGTTGTITIDGWNGSSWVQLDSFSNSGANSEVITRTSATLNISAYSKHRAAATGNGVVGCAIAELEFYEGLRLTAGAGTFTLTGNAVGLRVALHLIAVAGSFALTGVAVVLKRGRFLVAEVGEFVMTGNAVVLARAVHRGAHRAAKFVLRKIRVNPPSLKD